MLEYRKKLVAVVLEQIDANPGAYATPEDQNELLKDLISQHGLRTDKESAPVFTVSEYRLHLGNIVGGTSKAFVKRDDKTETHVNRMFRIGSGVLTQAGRDLFGIARRRYNSDTASVEDSEVDYDDEDEPEAVHSDDEYRPVGKKSKGHQQTKIKLNVKRSTHTSQTTTASSCQSPGSKTTVARAKTPAPGAGKSGLTTNAAGASGSAVHEAIGSKRKTAEADTQERKRQKTTDNGNVIGISSEVSGTTTPVENQKAEDSRVKAVPTPAPVRDARDENREVAQASASSSLTQASMDLSGKDTAKTMDSSPVSASIHEAETNRPAANGKGKREATEPAEDRQPKKLRVQKVAELSTDTSTARKSTKDSAERMRLDPQPILGIPSTISASAAKRPSDQDVDRAREKQRADRQITENASVASNQLQPPSTAAHTVAEAGAQLSSSQGARNLTAQPGSRDWRLQQARQSHRPLEYALAQLSNVEIDKCITTLTRAARSLAAYMFRKNTDGGSDQVNDAPEFVEKPSPRLERIYKQLFGEDWGKTSNILTELGVMENGSAVEGLAVAATMDMVFEQPVPWDGPKEVMDSLSYYCDSFDLSLAGYSKLVSLSKLVRERRLTSNFRIQRNSDGRFVPTDCLGSHA